jgi:DNA-binding GntR family transcriptional regulator
MHCRDEENGYVARVYKAVREMVIRYDYRPCHRLDIGEIASRLRVSRTPVREALNRLLNESLVVQYNNRGFYTRPLDVNEILALLELRDVMATAAVKLAFERGSDISLSDLAEAGAADCCSPPESHARMIAALMEIAGNAEFRKVWENVEARLHFFSLTYLSNKDRLAAEQRLRCALMSAVASRDLRGATDVLKAATAAYLKAAQGVVKEAFGQLYVGHGGGVSVVAGPRLLRAKAITGS